MKFQTKKDLLRYLGKNEDDRKLVDRMIARGEVVMEWRLYVIKDRASADDLEYLNREYEKLEGLLDYSLRKCYNIMKKKGLVGSEDTYDDFYAKITDGYSAGGVNVAHTTEGGEALKDKNDLNSVIQKFGISKASDFIS